MTIRIGNAQAFWGDRPTAAFDLLSSTPDLDFLTMDYLAEVSLSIMAAQRKKDPTKGYANDFLSVIRSLAPLYREGSRCKLICNAGGLNPIGCGEAVANLLRSEGLETLSVSVVIGDDVLPQMEADRSNELYANLENGLPLLQLQEPLTTANAYLGAAPIVDALRNGSDIVITGRVADPSLVVAACIASYDWKTSDYQKIAKATIAGHLIECGTQVTGGFSTNWLDVPDAAHIGYPIVEVEESGSFIVTKAPRSGGRVSIETVKEQLLYEVSDPTCYLSPDATVDFSQATVTQEGEDRVRVDGIQGDAPPDTYKVSATYFSGYRAEGLLAIVGERAPEKARRSGEVILQRLASTGVPPERSLVEILGAGGILHGILPEPEDLTEVMLRVAVADRSRECLERFAKEIAPLVTSGPQGVTGYTSGRPKIRPIYAYWPCLIERSHVSVSIRSCLPQESSYT